MSPAARERRVVDPADGFEPTIARWVWALEDVRQRTLVQLADIDQTTLDWRPAGGGNSIGTLLYHVVAIEMSYLYEDILGVGWADELEPLITHDVRDDEGGLFPVEGESLARHRERLDAARALLLSALADMDVDDFRRTRQTAEGTASPEWILHHLMQHEAEHRGQIGEVRQQAERASSR